MLFRLKQGFKTLSLEKSKDKNMKLENMRTKKYTGKKPNIFFIFLFRAQKLRKSWGGNR